MAQTISQDGTAPADGAAPAARPVPRWRKPWLRWLLLAAAVLVAGLLVWRLLEGRKTPARPPPPIPVGVATVRTGDMAVELSGIGTVTPAATITVEAIVSGLLFKVGFREGQIVRRGQLLDLIDPRPYENALAQAQGALVRDTGLLEQARSDLQRYELLGRQDSIAQQTVADQQYLVRQREGAVMEDRAAIQSAKLNLDYTRVRSPVTGRVGLRLVDAGNYIQTGAATALAVVTQLQPITVVFVLPEDDVAAVGEQLQAGAPLEVGAWDRSDSREIARGILLTIDNTVDTTTGTVKLRASFPNRDLALFPNEFVNARLRLRTLTGVTIVSARAVQRGAPGAFVYVLRPNGTAGVRTIRTGVAQGDAVQVLSGLAPGETVVVDGVDRLREGARVRVAPEGTLRAPPPNNGPGAPPGRQPQNAGPAGGGAGGGRAAANG